MSRDFRRELTDRIITALEEGTAPWQKPWDGSVVKRMMPFNPVSGVQYRGGNQFGMLLQPYGDPRWCTYKQAIAQGWQVRKGERSTPIEFWKWHDEAEEEDSSTGGTRKILVKRARPLVRYASVFNLSQMDNVPALEHVDDGYRWEPLEMAETVLARSGLTYVYDQSDRAFYLPASDRVHMPPRQAFPSAARFIATAMHELGHATGHPARLNRDLTGTFGSESYAREELRAELASFFLASQLGIDFDVGNHAAYVGAWIKVLREDKNEIFRASRDAEAIVDYVMALTPEKELARPDASERPVPAPSAAELRPIAVFPTSETAAPLVKRIYISVPYAEREQAKTLGAKWDKQRKSWYVPGEGDSAMFRQWMEIPKKRSESDLLDQFKEALTAAGLVVEGQPTMDGTWQRTTVSTSRNQKALKGAYIGNIIGQSANGYIRNFDTGYSKSWSPVGLVLSAELRMQYEEQAEAMRKRREGELAAERLRVAEQVGKKWNELPEAHTHPYLQSKGVHSFGLRLDGDRLVTPLRDTAGKLWSLQYIAADSGANKMYEKGGQKTRNFHLLGDLSGTHCILFGEGYATCASLHMATGLPVVEVFDSGNLDQVMKVLAPQLVGTAKVICGDDDVLTAERVLATLSSLIASNAGNELHLDAIHGDELQIGAGEIRLRENPACVISLDWVAGPADVPRIAGTIANCENGFRLPVHIANVGREKALEAAATYGGYAVFPEFSEDRGKRSDFNDLHQSEGLETVAAQVGHIVGRALMARTPEQCAHATLGPAAIVRLPEECGRYVGPVIANTAAHTVQDVGRQTAVAHEIAKLDRVPKVGEQARITYEEGRGAVHRCRDRPGITRDR